MNPVLIQQKAGEVLLRRLDQQPDIRAVAPEGSIGKAILSAMPEAMERLPVLPEISRRVLAMVSDPDVTMADLARVIREDQVIALSIMKLANSAVYGGLHQIKDLTSACARLGMKTIANTTQAVASNNLYITGDKKLRGSMQKLWRHAIATAHCASEIAAATAEPRGEALFLAGLIHDIGKVVLLEIITSGYSGHIKQLRESPELFREVMQAFHPLVGLHVVHRWNLPPEYGATTYFHHNPDACSVENWMGMVHVIALANTIANVEGYGMYKPDEVYLTTHSSARFLNLTDVKLAALRVDIADKLEALLSAVDSSAA
ncbi:MAG: HDOD domain-containing protein [Candidatus Hydrogenedentes bacterium]|nr:HDOD domain-containing protein [Candidatus Hydrogenedentota bacterium]